MANCPVCGGAAVLLGVLGRRVYSRCRDCGIDSSTTVGGDE